MPCKPCCSPGGYACINAIRRFICRRGSVKSIRSDQGTNFIWAQRELEESVKQLDNDRIQRPLLKRGIDWTFNPPSGAHHGGVWERLIRLVKNILYSVLKEQTLDDDGLWQGRSSTRHRSGFPWAPPTQYTGRCCTEMFIGVYRLVVFAELMVYGHDCGSSSSVCVDGWFILGCHDCSCTPGVQPHPARVQSV